MNLNELWSGTDYAYYEYKRRSELYRPNARRVKVIRAFKEKVYGNERLSGFAEVLFCDVETGEPNIRQDGTHHTGKVRARDIAMRWEEYAELDAHRKAERERVEAERRAERERREKERKEREELARKQRERAKNILVEKYGVPAEWITYVDDRYIYVSRPMLEQLLDTLLEQREPGGSVV